jgi:hexosaminidase
VQYFVDIVLVPGHPATREVLEHLVDAMARLFASSTWLHIGGDEVPDRSWSASPIARRLGSERGATTTRELEAVFHRDLVALIRDRTGRQVGAWQEAAESGGVDPGDGYVIGWRAAGDSRALAAAGYDVVVSPGQAYYLDMALDDRWDSPGGSWAGSSSLDEVCAFDPVAGWSDTERARVLGVQACLWSEHVHDRDVFEHLLLPRLDAIAERAWTGHIHGGPTSLHHRATLPTA